MKPKWFLSLLLLIIAVALLGVLRASALAGYSLDWWMVDGGGAAFSTSGSYSLGGSIGQPDAGTSGGGTYTLDGGFWGGDTSATYTPTPTKTLTHTPTPTQTPTQTPTRTLTHTPTRTTTLTPTLTRTPTRTITLTSTVSPTRTTTWTPTLTRTPTATVTPASNATYRIYLPLVMR